MCADPRLRERIYAQLRTERAARRGVTDGKGRGAFARLGGSAMAAPAVLLILLVFLAI